ncbi:FIG007959: peptidase, M16 family [hydrothermal vent metagenome]|uniref:FIG007959: peptidase, M16 family n=1 Tax=hydrothermal vent metagenome TaxID=652676 RepID=A0A3B1CI40_9ZZZZ
MIHENYKLTKLDNGIRIVTESLPHVNSFSLGFWFNTGSRNENSKNNGISHFTEHMLFKGTKQRTSKKLSDEVESLGGYLNAFTSKEHTCFYGRGLRQHLPKVFDVLSDMVQNSVFKESEIKKEAGVIVDELYDIEDTPEELIFDKFESILYEGNSLHYPIIGTEKNIRSFGHNDFINYIEKFYTNKNMIISASGDVNHEEIIKLVGSKFYYSKKNHRVRRKKINLNKSDDLIIQKEIQQAHAIIGRSAVGYDNNDRIKVNLLSHILGEGSSSRLFNTLREKNGITYQINSFLSSFSDVSSFGVYFSTGEKSLQKATDLVYKEFDKMIHSGINKREFNRAKEYLKGQLLMHLESTSNRMIRMAQSLLYYNKVRLIQQSIDNINAVSLDEILDISKSLLNTEQFCKVIISSKQN